MLRPLTPLGQFRSTFIIAIDDEGIAIIDQHVAHERILFEQISERLTAGRLESQRLLTPMIVDLSPAQRQALTAHRETLDKFGLEVEEFGGDGPMKRRGQPHEVAKCFLFLGSEDSSYLSGRRGYLAGSPPRLAVARPKAVA